MQEGAGGPWHRWRRGGMIPSPLSLSLSHSHTHTHTERARERRESLVEGSVCVSALFSARTTRKERDGSVSSVLCSFNAVLVLRRKRLSCTTAVAWCSLHTAVSGLTSCRHIFRPLDAKVCGLCVVSIGMNRSFSERLRQMG